MIGIQSRVEWKVDTQEIMGDGDMPSLTPSLARFLSNIVYDLMTGMILWVTGCRESTSDDLIKVKRKIGNTYLPPM